MMTYPAGYVAVATVIRIPESWPVSGDATARKATIVPPSIMAWRRAKSAAHVFSLPGVMVR